MSIGYGYKWTQTGEGSDQSGVDTFALRGMTIGIELCSLSDAQKVGKPIDHVAKIAKAYAKRDMAEMVIPTLTRIKESADAELAGGEL